MQEQPQIKAKSDGHVSHDISDTTVLTNSSKKISELQMQSELRKLKQIVSIEKQLHHNRQEYQKVNKQIHQFQQDFKERRKRAITQKIQSIQKKKVERQHHNQESNSMLHKIKLQNKRRRLKMESIIKMYKDQYEQTYQKKIQRRKQQMKFDFQAIKVHQSQYIKAVNRRKSFRVKTENCNRYIDQIPQYTSKQKRVHSPFHNQNDDKIEKLKQLAQKRKQYGQKAQKNASNVRVTADMVKKGKNYKSKSGFDNNIDVYQIQKKKMQKPRLDTNFTGDVSILQKKELLKLAEQKKSPVRDKLTRLKDIADGYHVQLQNGHSSALDKMCNINILRAQLLLDS